MSSNTHTPITEKFWDLEAALGEVVLERFDEIHGASLALITQEHHFTLGTPGIAKTMLPDQLVQRISGMKEGDYFSTLLSKSTPTEELFGVYDMEMMLKSTYKRMTEGMLPNAKLATLDEVFKGSAATLNGMLTMLNERWFKNHGEDRKRPLMTAFLMSNELAESETLNALWDRLTLRYHSHPISDTSNFMRMLTAELDMNPEPLIDITEIEASYDLARVVKIPDAVLEAIKVIKDELEEAGIYVTDRRWRKAISIIRAEAWMNGNEIATISDLKPLAHTLWNDVNEIEPVQSVVRNLSDPVEAEALALLQDISEAYTTYKEQREKTEDRTLRTKAGLRMYRKYEDARKSNKSLAERIDSRRSDAVTRLKKKLDSINSELSATLHIDQPEA